MRQLGMDNQEAHVTLGRRNRTETHTKPHRTQNTKKMSNTVPSKIKAGEPICSQQINSSGCLKDTHNVLNVFLLEYCSILLNNNQSIIPYRPSLIVCWPITIHIKSNSSNEIYSINSNWFSIMSSQSTGL
jgi:hypothetical protein